MNDLSYTNDITLITFTFITNQTIDTTLGKHGTY